VGGGGLEGGQDGVKIFCEKCVWMNYAKLQAIQGSKMKEIKAQVIIQHHSHLSVYN